MTDYVNKGGSVVRLSVHKNTLDKRQRNQLRQSLKDAVHDMYEENDDYDGFFLVAFKRIKDEDGDIAVFSRWSAKQTDDVFKTLPDIAVSYAGRIGK